MLKLRCWFNILTFDDISTGVIFSTNSQQLLIWVEKLLNHGCWIYVEVTNVFLWIFKDCQTMLNNAESYQLNQSWSVNPFSKSMHLYSVEKLLNKKQIKGTLEYISVENDSILGSVVLKQQSVLSPLIQPWFNSDSPWLNYSLNFV